MRALPVLVLSLLALTPGGGWAADPEIALAVPPVASVVTSDRVAIADFYRREYRAGRCPDGLRHTEQGCERGPLWTVGQPLAPSILSVPLPPELLAKMGPAPHGTHFVRVHDHVLLVETGSRMVRADLLDLGQIGPGQVTPPLRVGRNSSAAR